jgi:hypothetical protein
MLAGPEAARAAPLCRKRQREVCRVYVDVGAQALDRACDAGMDSCIA